MLISAMLASPIDLKSCERGHADMLTATGHIISFCNLIQIQEARLSIRAFAAARTHHVGLVLEPKDRTGTRLS